MSDFSYKIPVADTLSEAWGKVSGAKATVWAALLIIFATAIIFAVVANIFSTVSPTAENIIKFIGQILIVYFQAGLIYIGIERAFEKPITYKQIFKPLHSPYWWRYILLYILQMLCFIIPIAILIGAGFIENQTLSALVGLAGIILTIFIAVRISFSIGFLLDQNHLPLQALKASYQVTSGNVWRIIAIMLAQWIIVLISIIPLGIGLIWTLPFCVTVFGVVYKRLVANLVNPT